MGELYERFQDAWDAPVRGRGDLDDKLGALYSCAENAAGEDRELLEAFLLPRLERGDSMAGGLLARMRSKRGRDRILALAKVRAHWTASIDLMIGLAWYPGDAEVAEILRAQLDHPDYLVRHHASASLLTVVGLRSDRWADDLQRLTYLLNSELPAVRRRGLALLDEAVRRHDAGEPLGDLAGPWRPPEETWTPALHRLNEVLADPEAPPFGPDDLAALASAEEEFLLTVLVARLTKSGERRSAEALAVLAAEGAHAGLARAALQEAAALDDPAVAAAARAVLGRPAS